MTEIDVPDWVVKAAEDARVHRLNAVTAYGSAGVDERYHMAMRAALTAALGAWVVPVAVSREHDASRPTFGDVVPNDSQEADMWAYALVPLYTLRQEKPE